MESKSCNLALQRIVQIYGPAPIRNLSWSRIAVVCIRGTNSCFHVDKRNGLTYTACCGKGGEGACLQYEDGVVAVLGRFWTEIIPSRPHRVSAAVERRAVSVYTLQEGPYQVQEKHNILGPMQHQHAFS
eukprot:4309190-Amphidinium_carterae.2